ncbi:MAG: tRNA dihydrouridine synthase DusB [Pseudohongiellaceae bacterium]
MFKIGTHTITNPLLLAPMAGVSDKPFRETCAAQGAGLTVAEMLTSNLQLWDSDKNRLRQAKPGISGPQIVQIAGADPQMMAQAAVAHVESGADIIDINMGCPAKKVLQKAAGSALLKDIQQVESILRAVIDAVDVPVTLKIRTGWCTQSRNGVQVARLAEQLGIAMITVHGRTRQCRFLGNAEYDTIAAIKQSVAIPVIANGDITTPEKAAQVRDYTGADGLMIGRAAQGRPWLFREISHFLRHRKRAPGPGLREISGIILTHVDGIHRLYGDFRGVLFARKHVNWYLRQLALDNLVSAENTSRFWQSFNLCACTNDQITMLNEFFDHLTIDLTIDTRVLAA